MFNAGAGRLATIGIVIERSSDPALIGQGFLLYVEDGDAIDAAQPGSCHLCARRSAGDPPLHRTASDAIADPP